MPEEYILQPLTTKDKISVLLYRAGIGLTGFLMLVGALLLMSHLNDVGAVWDERFLTGSSTFLWLGVVISGIYIFTGLSVINIHLYMGSLKRFLKGMYFFSLGLFLILCFLGNGNPAVALFKMPLSGAMLLPLGCSIAFIGAKEAYCFNLLEGYVMAVFITVYILLWPVAGYELKIYGLLAISVLTLFLAFRKAVMPLSFDIGDKSRYVP